MGKWKEWLIAQAIALLGQVLTPDVLEGLKKQALAFIMAWAQKLPAGLSYIVVALAEALFSDDHDAAAKAFVCWAKSQVAKTDNKIDDAFVDVLAGALGVDANSCPVPAPAS